MAIKKKVTKKGSSLTALKDPDASRSKPSTNIYLDPSTASLPSPSYTAEELIDTSNGMSSVEVQALRDDFQIECETLTPQCWTILPAHTRPRSCLSYAFTVAEASSSIGDNGQEAQDGGVDARRAGSQDVVWRVLAGL
jgi:hypothetical protein